ncbi:MAG: hypothetical protein JNN07_05430 [Verrucomicrobiales bacterium]|nr:hypothetical protein [Verrucomicrobiales bacterium]
MSPWIVLRSAVVVLALVTHASSAPGQAPAPPTTPPRLTRAESFLGIHFDFHAGADCHEIGKNTTTGMLETILRTVRPDYLQTDCKGHPGFSSYPTKVGNPAPGFVGNPLRLWREVTARHGVALYVHYSGVWDSEAIRQHPNWAAIDASGKANGNATSFWSPYADQLLIPQLRELAGDYGLDGVWVDGECWASVPDYSPAALEAFKKATGIAGIPRKPSDPHWVDFLQFHREAFRGYLRHYLSEVKKTHPGFALCSNWAFTDHMAEPVSVPVDFLSGDYSPEDSVNSARLSGRYLVRQGKPWDLMAWSFGTKPKHQQKTSVQLQREAAVVVALGGGFQAYFTQNRDGSVRLEEIPAMGEVAQFCRARQALCHRSQPVPQVAVLLSTAGHYRRLNGLFNRDLGAVHGVLRALLENRLSVEVVGEHQVTGRLADYPLIVVPEWAYLEAPFRNELVAYGRAGGKLLVVGTEAAEQFLPELDIQIHREAKSLAGSVRTATGLELPVKKGLSTVTLGSKARAFAQWETTNNPANSGRIAVSIAALGQGKIAGVYFPLGQQYARQPSDEARHLVGELTRELFPNPVVKLEGPGEVDVCLARKAGNLLVNLVNAGGPHRTQSILETIPAAGPFTASVRVDQAPKKVTLEPAGRMLPFEYRDGSIQLAVPAVAIHEAIVIHPL